MADDARRRGRTPGSADSEGLPPGRRREKGPETTHAEAAWYVRQVEAGRGIVVRLRDGTELRGVLEWYDRAALRLGLPDGAHRIVPKRAIAWLASD